MDSFSNVFAVVLAGGSGTRLWPKSRKRKPKQLCKFGNEEKTLLERTLARLDGKIPPKNRIVITNHSQVKLTKKIIGPMCDHVIAEPCSRNTAAALALGATYIRQLPSYTPDTAMLSWHADHLLTADKNFWSSHEDGLAAARKDHLTLMGIFPRKAHTGFGYIKKGKKFEGLEAHSVQKFLEKPRLELAESFIKQGGYLWNSGIFIWKVAKFWSELQKYLPETANALERFEGYLDVFEGLENISIDHAVLEKSEDVAVVECNIQWQDIGSFDAYRDVFERDEKGNIVFGPSYMERSKNNIVDTDRFTALIGIEGITVVSSGNALLVCKTEEAQNVKKIVEHLKTKKDEGLY